MEADVEFEQTGMPLGTVIRHHVLATLVVCGGNRTRAAKVLQISVRGLRDKLREYATEGIAIPPVGIAKSRSAGLTSRGADIGCAI